MHLLAAQPGGFSDDEGIIDLDQSPADIVLLSAADSALAALAHSCEQLPIDYPSVRLANWMQLKKPAALDLYIDKTLEKAKVVVVSLLGGAAYWSYVTRCTAKSTKRFASGTCVNAGAALSPPLICPPDKEGS